MIPAAFKDRIASIHGQTGQNWLDNLPGLQARFIQRWSLGEVQPIPDPSYNFIAYCSTADNAPAVLKMGVPHPELDAEIQSLRAFNGNGAVRLIDADPHQGVLLVERIIPGDDLRTVDDDRAATRIAARLMKVLWMPDPHDPVFPSTAAWCQGFQRYQHTQMANGPLPFDLVQLAGRVAADLLQSAADPVLLHGDLHHMNILKSGDDAWVAIDPKGVIGEAAFEVGALLLNPVPDLIHWPDLQETQKERLIILEEELGIDRQRLAAWSFVRAVLSAIWSLEDGEDFEYGVAVAKIMKKLL